ncbi:ArnT family glycosyltransferase [Nanoarchaeota archaeon]
MRKQCLGMVWKRLGLIRGKNPYLFLAGILLLGLLMRLPYIGLCEVGDRGQTVFGMTNNLPPLYHYVTAPFLGLTGDLWYAPVFANILLGLGSIIILFFLGRLIKNSDLGLIMAFLFAILPTSLLLTKYISPEVLELFFIVLISYLFLRLEVYEKEERRNLWLLMYFLALVIGAFSKQQTLAVLFPIFLFGLYRHRLGIFKKEIYYISGLAVIPYVFFLFAHPELLAAVKIYYLQPLGQRTLLMKLWEFSTIFLLYYAVHSVLVLWFFARIKHYWSAYSRHFMVFLMIFLGFYCFFLIKTDLYVHLLAIPILLVVGLVIFNMRSAAVKAFSLILLLLYSVFGFIVMVPGLSIVTAEMCEFDAFGLPHTVLMKLAGKSSPGDMQFFQKNPEVKDILDSERYVLIGGNTGQDLKYNIRSRLYYAGVMNAPVYEEINYAVLITPIDAAYTGAPAWDYPYLRQVKKNSEVVLEKQFHHRTLLLLKINDHSLDKEGIPDFRERGRKGLKLDGP